MTRTSVSFALAAVARDPGGILVSENDAVRTGGCVEVVRLITHFLSSAVLLGVATSVKAVLIAYQHFGCFFVAWALNAHEADFD